MKKSITPLIAIIIILSYLTVLSIMSSTNTHTAYSIILEDGTKIPTKTLHTDARYKHLHIQCIENVIYFRKGSYHSPLYNIDSTIKTCKIEENLNEE